MIDGINKIVFLVGMGAPIELYSAFLKDFQQYTKLKINCIAWWDEADFGKQTLENILQDSQTLLLAHSAGGIVAMHLLATYPQYVKRMVMLDTHILPNVPNLPPVYDIIDVMIRHNHTEFQKLIIDIYEPVIKNDTNFYTAFRHILNWNEHEMSAAVEKIKLMKAHTALHIGFTADNYDRMNLLQQQQQIEFWQQYNIDAEILSMYHFDLVLPEVAAEISPIIINWLNNT